MNLKHVSPKPGIPGLKPIGPGLDQQIVNSLGPDHTRTNKGLILTKLGPTRTNRTNSDQLVKWSVDPRPKLNK